MADTVRTTAALVALLSDSAPAHSTNRQLIRDIVVSKADVLTDFGKLGTLPPLPGTQLLIGLSAVMSSPPTVTEGIANAASTIASAVFHPATVNSSGTFILSLVENWRYLEGSIVVKAQSFPDRQYAVPANVQGAVNSGSIAVEFEFDGSQFDFMVKGFGGQWYRVNVDGQLVNATGSAGPAATGSPYFIHVQFTTRANRRIKLEFSAAGHFGGINIGPNDTIWPSSVPIGPKVIVAGDSYVGGTGASSSLSAFWDTMGRLLGWTNLRATGLGGSGYLAGSTTLRGRLITDVLAFSPDIVVITMGHNDVTSYTGAAIQAEATLVFAQIRAALPNVKLIVSSNLVSSGSPSADTIATRNAIQAALLTDPGPNLFIDTIVAAVAGANTLGWITGTGRVGAATGSGNADLYIANDNVHPSQSGHDYYGRRFASAISLAMPF